MPEILLKSISFLRLAQTGHSFDDAAHLAGFTSSHTATFTTTIAITGTTTG